MFWRTWVPSGYVLRWLAPVTAGRLSSTQNSLVVMAWTPIINEVEFNSATVQFAAAQYGVESAAFLRIPWFDKKYGFEKLRLAFLVAPVSPFMVIAPIPISMRPAPTAVSRGWKSRKSVHWYCV